MPNVISKERRSVTFLENRKVVEWMEAVARERGTDLSVILREATSAYYLQHREASSSQGTLFAKRVSAKAAQRRETARKLARRELTAEQAQKLNAPVHGDVKLVDMWSAIRRHTHGK